ncbi:uncharacterized protein BDW70DRAFT_128239 [Aspergillus foveolatus]|uniref:uncharacterized protein n=1 Tax=Aspergillus foveolatus TaxID=210207 RepID=UPI003CCCD908
MLTIRSPVQLSLRCDAIDWTCLMCSSKPAIASFRLEATILLAVASVTNTPPSDR